MPLPQQVIEQLGRDPETSRTFASGALIFSVGILAITAALYLGMVFGYEPYLNNQISGIKSQVSTANNSISTDQETQLVDFYSQIANLQSILSHHVYATSLISWLENNTQANIYYQSMDFSAGNLVALKGVAKAESDVNQQIAIFESSPDVKSVSVSSIAPVSAPGGGTSSSGVAFAVTLTMQPSVFSSQMP